MCGGAAGIARALTRIGRDKRGVFVLLRDAVVTQPTADVEGAEEAILGASRRLGDIGFIMGELHYGVIDRTAFEAMLGRFFDYVIENEEAACATFKGKSRSRSEAARP